MATPHPKFKAIMKDQQTLDKSRNGLASLKERIHRHMNNDTTYALLVQSEEKGRSIMETAVYALLGLSAILSILQFVQQPERMPTTLTTQMYEISHTPQRS
jgi:hypothetical protein